MYYIDLDKDTPDRFDFAKFMEFGNDCHDILNSYFVSKLKNLPMAGEMVVQAEEHRADLLSYNIYGDTQYWWIIMLYNNILNVEDIISGLTITYPSVDSLEDLFFSLKALERTEGR